MTPITSRTLLLTTAIVLAGCSAAETDEAAELEAVVDTAEQTASETGETVADVVDVMRDDQDISTLPAGRYEDEDGHAYIAFSYDHQGFSNPILRFNGDAFDAAIDLVPDNPTASTVEVVIDATDIDSGVDVFNEHLAAPDFFDSAAHPEITYRATTLAMDTPTTGTMLGDLTMKGITKPLALDVTLNKAGEHFRSKTPMFGISATGELKRSDWDLGLYAPVVGDEVELMIEVEFQKADAG